ncbi:hypothetical protein A2U01_0046987, partial [Trifolium medium]|nr:hypothetical protein [Trifolium medium]
DLWSTDDKQHWDPVRASQWRVRRTSQHFLSSRPSAASSPGRGASCQSSLLCPVLHRIGRARIHRLEWGGQLRWGLWLLGAGGFADEIIALGGCIKTSSCSFYVPVEGSNLPFMSIVLHLHMGSGGDGDQVSDGRSADDALIEGWAVQNQEFDLDRLCSLLEAKGNDEVDVSPRLCSCPVEPL